MTCDEWDNNDIDVDCHNLRHCNHVQHSDITVIGIYNILLYYSVFQPVIAKYFRLVTDRKQFVIKNIIIIKQIFKLETVVTLSL